VFSLEETERGALAFVELISLGLAAVMKAIPAGTTDGRSATVDQLPGEDMSAEDHGSVIT
jgi:hypothetical protein